MKISLIILFSILIIIAIAWWMYVKAWQDSIGENEELYHFWIMICSAVITFSILAIVGTVYYL